MNAADVDDRTSAVCQLFQEESSQHERCQRVDLERLEVYLGVECVDVTQDLGCSEVDDACKHLIEIWMPDSGFILGPGCALGTTTPVDNIHALVESAKKHGLYC